jgi:hypothetical protein
MAEELFVLDGAPAATRECGQMREQEPTDTWAVHQLYHAAVPREVQFAEAWTSHQWDLPGSKRMKSRRRSFVLEDGHQIGAYARVRTGSRAASLEVMYLPDYRHALESFCSAVMYRTMRDAGATRIFIPARAYQMELMSALDRLGFVRVGQQDLLVKYTTAKVVAKPGETVVLAPADVRERIPERVPTFLNRRSGKESSA